MLDGLRLRFLRDLVARDRASPNEPKPEVPTSSPEVDRLLDGRALTFAKTQGRSVRSVEHTDAILYAGMNATSAPVEIAALRSTGANVIVVVVGQSTDPLAAIAKAWAGGARPTRLVLSGHSSGDDVNDGGTHALAFEGLRALAKAMPEAAKYIEDIQLSGCNTAINFLAGAERERWLEAFPSLQTMWGYQGSCDMAPGDQMIAWESATRGDHPHVALGDRLVAANVHVFDRGRLDGDAVRMPKTTVDARLAEADANFERWMRDTDADKHDPYNPMIGQANMYRDYQAYRVAQARDDFATGRSGYAARADRLLLRRYQDTVAKNFAAKYGAEIAKAGLAATSTRKQMLDAARALFARTPVGSKAEVDTLRPLYAALETFDVNLIPRDWWRSS